MTILLGFMLALAALPLIVALANLRLLKPPVAGHPQFRISVLIPARNEETNIRAAVEAVLANGHPDFEVLVLDDHSTDATTAVVEAVAARDRRVVLHRAPALPPGWCGKPHACHVLSGLASGELLLFVDADVRLSCDALARIDGFMAAHPGTGLASGVPRQVTGSLFERLVIPMIDFLLVGYLPVWRMRRSSAPAYAAGCGQLIVARRDPYRQAGGHRAVPMTMHDGVKLPRRFRTIGIMTDLFDAAPIAACRMYAGRRQVWDGFSKNATEGMATKQGLPAWTLLLGGGHVLPFLTLAAMIVAGTGGVPLAFAAAACVVSWSSRLVIGLRFGDTAIGIVLHPAGVAIMLAIQWCALLRLGKRQNAWRGRTYPQK